MYRLLLLSVIFLQNFNSVNLKPVVGITGGHDANIEDFPYQLVITSTFSAYFCSAALITPTWALTTAHCATIIKLNSMNYYYYYYEFNIAYLLSNTSIATEGVRQEIETYYIHPDYNETVNLHDIALLKLTEPVDCINCKPVDLASSSPNVGDVITVTGWGVTDIYTMNFPKVLQVVELPVVTRDECDKSYPDLINENILCAYFKDEEVYRSACAVDEGSPAVVDGKLVGLFSVGYCKEPGFAGIYTDVVKYKEWIDGIIVGDIFFLENL